MQFMIIICIRVKDHLLWEWELQHCCKNFHIDALIMQQINDKLIWQLDRQLSLISAE